MKSRAVVVVLVMGTVLATGGWLLQRGFRGGIMRDRNVGIAAPQQLNGPPAADRQHSHLGAERFLECRKNRGEQA